MMPLLHYGSLDTSGFHQQLSSYSSSFRPLQVSDRTSWVIKDVWPQHCLSSCKTTNNTVNDSSYRDSRSGSGLCRSFMSDCLPFPQTLISLPTSLLFVLGWRDYEISGFFFPDPEPITDCCRPDPPWPDIINTVLMPWRSQLETPGLWSPGTRISRSVAADSCSLCLSYSHTLLSPECPGSLGSRECLFWNVMWCSVSLGSLGRI